MAVAGFIFDVDGCVARGNQAIPGAPEALAELRRLGHRVAFCSNEATRTREQMATRLQAMGIAAEPSEVVTAAVVAADYVGRAHPGATVFAVGSPVLLQSVAERGATLAGPQAERADVVLIGRDEDFSYARLSAACNHIWAGAEFLAINLDRKLPSGSGFVPGTGAIVMAVSHATGKEPIVLGKPSVWAAQASLSALGLEAAEVVVVGDQIDQDIRMGVAAGCRTVLVLTGGSTREDAGGAGADRRPDAVLQSVADLPAWLETLQGAAR